MTETITRSYYKIRFPAKAGTYGEFYTSNNGTDQWSEPSKVKTILTRGQAKGYKGSIRLEFVDYEIVKYTETVQIAEEVVTF